MSSRKRPFDDSYSDDRSKYSRTNAPRGRGNDSYRGRYGQFDEYNGPPPRQGWDNKGRGGYGNRGRGGSNWGGNRGKAHSYGNHALSGPVENAQDWEGVAPEFTVEKGDSWDLAWDTEEVSWDSGPVPDVPWDSEPAPDVPWDSEPAPEAAMPPAQDVEDIEIDWEINPATPKQREEPERGHREERRLEGSQLEEGQIEDEYEPPEEVLTPSRKPTFELPIHESRRAYIESFRDDEEIQDREKEFDQNYGKQHAARAHYNGSRSAQRSSSVMDTDIQSYESEPMQQNGAESNGNLSHKIRPAQNYHQNKMDVTTINSITEKEPSSTRQLLLDMERKLYTRIEKLERESTAKDRLILSLERTISDLKDTNRSHDKNLVTVNASLQAVRSSYQELNQRVDGLWSIKGAARNGSPASAAAEQLTRLEGSVSDLQDDVADGFWRISRLYNRCEDLKRDSRFGDTLQLKWDTDGTEFLRWSPDGPLIRPPQNFKAKS